MIESATLTRHHVRYLFQNLSELNRQELKGLAIADWENYAANVINWKTGDNRLYLDRFGPLFAFGLNHRDFGFSCWFIGTQRYFDQGARMVRPTRRIMDAIRAKHPDAEFICYTRSGHPDVERWFRLLGFDCKGRSPKARVFWSGAADRPALAVYR
jgi:hypothetical protein